MNKNAQKKEHMEEKEKQYAYFPRKNFVIYCME